MEKEMTREEKKNELKKIWGLEVYCENLEKENATLKEELKLKKMENDVNCKKFEDILFKFASGFTFEEIEKSISAAKLFNDNDEFYLSINR